MDLLTGLDEAPLSPRLSGAGQTSAASRTLQIQVAHAEKWLERGLSAGKKPRRRRRGKGDGEGMCSYTGMLHGLAPLTITSLEEEGALWLGDECVTSPSTPQHGPVEIEVPDYKVGIGR